MKFAEKIDWKSDVILSEKRDWKRDVKWMYVVLHHFKVVNMHFAFDT